MILGLDSNFAHDLFRNSIDTFLDPALKGHYILAQGNALGEDLTTISALKGRYKII